MQAGEELPQDSKSLSTRNAHEISDQRWDYDVGKIVDLLEQIGREGKTT
ncbi:MAG: hypothetical protein AAF657_17075 [Acidobacteriota bacterium]